MKWNTLQPRLSEEVVSGTRNTTLPLLCLDTAGEHSISLPFSFLIKDRLLKYTCLSHPGTLEHLPGLGIHPALMTRFCDVA